MDFSQVNNLKDLENLILKLNLSADNFKRFTDLLRNLNNNNYETLLKMLNAIGFTDQDDMRIFRYNNGLFKFNNHIKSQPHTRYDINKDYTIINNQTIISNQYLINTDGVVVPVYYDGRYITILDDSEYYLIGNKVLTITSVYEGIQYVTNYKIDSDDINVLLKYIDKNTNYIVIKDQNRVYNINATVLKLDKVEVDNSLLITTMHKLDEINQPYPKGYLINNDKVDNILLKMLARPERISTINQLVGQYFIKGDTNVYEQLGFTNLCIIPSLVFDFDAMTISNPNIHNLINNCQYDYIIIGIGITVNSAKHQMVLILDKSKKDGYLFDPSYSINSNAATKYYNYIIKYIKGELTEQKLNFDINIKSSNELTCPYMYSLQSDVNDLYCITWSFYISLLYLLNPSLTLQEIINFLYTIPKEQIKVIIPRFLIWAFKEDLAEILLEF